MCTQFLAEHLRMEDVRLYMRDLLQVSVPGAQAAYHQGWGS